MPRLNRKLVIQHLEETIEHIESAIEEAKTGNAAGYEAFMESAYLDFNRAWNARFMSTKKYWKEFSTAAHFPDDLDMSMPE